MPQKSRGRRGRPPRRPSNRDLVLAVLWAAVTGVGNRIARVLRRSGTGRSRRHTESPRRGDRFWRRGAQSPARGRGHWPRWRPIGPETHRRSSDPSAARRWEGRATRLVGGTIVMAFVWAALTGGAVSSPAAPPTDYRLGAAISIANLPLAGQTGLGWTRVPIFWSQVERTQGVYHLLNVPQEWTAAAEGEAIVGDVEGVPAWALANKADGPDSMPAGLYLPWNDPQNTWGQFMYWLARHYAGLIDTWVVGDEISIAKGPHETWSGTLPQFARLLEVAQQAATAANPSAQILPPASPYWYTHGRTDAALLQDLDALPGARAHHDYISGLDMNLYNTVLFNRMIYARYQGMLKATLRALPIWLSETNVAAETLGNPTGADPVQQASFVVEQLAASFAYVTRAEIYKMQDASSNIRYDYGMVLADGQPRLEVTALRTTIDELRGATWLRQAIMHENRHHTLVPQRVAVVTFGAPRELIQIVWDQGSKPTTVSLPAHTSQATEVNLWGESHPIASVAGRFVLRLPGATYEVPPSPFPTIGGEPEFVIQQVGLGQDGTPRHPNYGSPSGFAPIPTGRWSHRRRWPSGQVLLVQVNTPGDEVVIDNDGEVHWIEDAGLGADQINAPVAAVVGPHDRIYIANDGNNDVLVYNADGRFLYAFGGYPALLGVSGIAVNARGDVYVSDTGLEVVAEYTARGHYLRSFGGWGARPGQLDGVSGLLLSPKGLVYAADTLNQRIAIYTAKGRLVREVPVTVDDPVQLRWRSPRRLWVESGITHAWSSVTLPKPPRRHR